MAGVSAAPPRLLFADGLGQRVQIVGSGNQPLALMVFDKELTANTSFEPALRECIEQLAAFTHPSFARVRGVARLTNLPSSIAIVSEPIEGVRLSELLAAADTHLIPLEIGGATFLLRQLLPAIAALHTQSARASHGAIAPERLIVTPDARLIVVEQVLGLALERLQLSHDRYWRQFRIAAPPGAAAARLDQRADVMQCGVLALALILGRPLTDDEYPARIEDLVGGVRAILATGLEPLDAGLQAWLRRALQLEGDRSFATALEARDELNRVLPAETAGECLAFEEFLLQCQGAIAAPAAAPLPAPGAAPAPAAVTAPMPAAERVAARQERAVVLRGPMWEEQREEVEDTMQHTPVWRRKPILVAAVIVMALASVAAVGARRFLVSEVPGRLAVTTFPAEAVVVVDGIQRGLSPVTMELTPGVHVMTLTSGDLRRTIPLEIPQGGQVSQHIEFPVAAPEPDLPIQAVVASVAAPQPAPQQANLSLAGWITVAAPLDVQIYENQRLVGSSRSERIMLPVGRHELDIVEESLGFRASRIVQVTPGNVATVRLDWPRGTLALNALPWAEVWIDGERMGETPIGNVQLPIGPHQVLFRHPELGEQTHRVVVTLNAPARVSADLRAR